MYNKEVLSQFLYNSNNNSVISLAGTGSVGSAQVPILLNIGKNRFFSCTVLNVISGSSFSYFIYLAILEGKLTLKNFSEFDAANRRLHKASFLGACRHVIKGNFLSKSRYPNEKMYETVLWLFDDSFSHRPLAQLPKNVRFWLYCQARQALICVTPETPSYNQLTVADLIRASSSLKFLHGPFIWHGHEFVDPNYSPEAKQLRRNILRTPHPHLLVNYKKNLQRGSTTYLKHNNNKLPDISLLLGVLAFYFNFHNRELTRINRSLIKACTS